MIYVRIWIKIVIIIIIIIINIRKETWVQLDNSATNMYQNQ
jgi:hypothetical protein